MEWELPWVETYKNEFDKEIITPEHYAFVYEIENLVNGRKYIGKKTLWFKKTKQVKGKKKKELVESDWRDYWGSNAELLKDVELYGKEKFKRRILKLCKTKGEATYYETKFIFAMDALLLDSYYNTWIMCRVRKSHICPSPKAKRKNQSTTTQKS